jgi:hypothetical protein
MLSSGSSVKHSWSQWRAWGGVTARGKRRGSLGLLWLECGFPITRKLFGRDSEITRCSLKPKGRDGNGGLETKRKRSWKPGFTGKQNCGMEATGSRASDGLGLGLSLPNLPPGRCLSDHKAPLE